MKCNFNLLRVIQRGSFWLIAWLALGGLLPSCRPATPPSEGSAQIPKGPALPLGRIEIVGASVSAGFGGTPFGDAFAAAAQQSKVDASANTFLFRDPLGDTRRQLAQATAFAPTVVFGLDLLFWDVYGSGDRAGSGMLEAALAELDPLHANGAWIVLGDIPLITTASEMLLPKSAIPDAATLTAANAKIRGWASRERVLLVPLAAWTEPLRTGAEVELAPGEKVPAAELMSFDGLHANPLGTWYLLNRLDHYIEEKLPGTPKGALVFRRPPAP